MSDPKRHAAEEVIEHLRTEGKLTPRDPLPGDEYLYSWLQSYDYIYDEATQQWKPFLGQYATV